MRLLLAEDERELLNALAAILKHHHYTVDTVSNGRDALDYCLCGEYDGVILDIMMPGLSGLQVLCELRKRRSAVPVLLLTAKSEIEDRITGLDTGANDYLTKPFDTRELLARIRAMLRRKEDFSPCVLDYGGIHLNTATFELQSGKESLQLRGKEFRMLELLMQNPQRLISTEQFMEQIWGCAAEAEVNVVWVSVSSLRKKLAALKTGVEIKAVRGAGYRLEARA